MKHTLVVLSGGQDSVTCLGLALYRMGIPKTCPSATDKVSAISFSYNQRHKVELECASRLCAEYNVDHKIVDLGFFSELVTSALVGDGEVGLPHAYKPGLPSSFVPNRNALFLTVAHAYAQEIKADSIMTGVCETDYSGYPDCRDIFIQALQNALNTGYETTIQIETPLMYRTKAETFQLADSVGFLDEVIYNSHTCYNGDHNTLNAWGYGCGTCPACELRARGWEEYQRLKSERKLNALDL